MTSKQLFLGVALLFGCGSPAIQPPPAAAPIPHVEIIDGSRTQVAIGAAKPSDVASAVVATYRLRPDRRFLMAVADVYELNARHRETVQIDFSHDRWRIRCGNRDVGDLPELPTFSDGLELLTKWAATFPSAAGRLPASVQTLSAIDGDLAQFGAPALFRAMQQPVQQRGLPDSSVLRRWVRAMTLLNLQTIDRFGLADPVRARALAAIATMRAGDPTASDEDVALLAHFMGYDREAEEMAARLTTSSFATVSILGTHTSPTASIDLPTSYAEAAAAISHAHDRYPEDSVGPWFTTLQLRALPLLLQASAFENVVSIARAVAGVLTTEVENPEAVETTLAYGGAQDWLRAIQAKYALATASPAEIQRQFESRLPKRIAASRSILASDVVVRSYYESLFYSALHEEFHFDLHMLASQTAAQEFASSLGEGSPLAKQVKNWMTDTITITWSSGEGIWPLRLVKKFPEIDGHRRAEILLQLEAAVTNIQPLRIAADEIYRQLDSRPQQMYDGGRVSQAIIGDPLRRDRYMATAIARAPSVAGAGELAWFYFITTDRKALRALAERDDVSAGERARAVEYLSKLGEADDAFVDAKFETLLRQAGYDMVYPTYAGILNRRHQWKTKERLAEAWLLSHANADPISKAYYASSLANALERQGRYEEAWTAIKSHVPVFNEDVVANAVSILQRLGREREANDLGKQMIERYPDVAVRGDFAAVLWREKRYEEAAALFDPKSLPFSRGLWNAWVPDDFADTFEGDADAARRAFEALMRQGLDSRSLESIVKKFMEREQPAIAFALAERLSDANPVTPHNGDAAGHLILAFHALGKWKGSAAAHEWIRSRVPDAAALEMAGVAYQHSEFDLVAEVASPRVLTRKTVEMETYLAASLVHMRVGHDDPRWVALKEETKKHASQPGSLVVVNQYLLDLIDERTFMAQAVDAEWTCTVDYFVGVKLAAADDYDRALSFLIGAADGPATNPPEIWAVGLLYKWLNTPGRWEQVKRRRVM
jgi:tetratricopeptide (TPR) repeat protein